MGETTMHFFMGVLTTLLVFFIARRVFWWRRRSAHGRGWHGPRSYERWVQHRVDYALRKLKATDEQKTRVKAIQDRLLSEATELYAQHRRIREEVSAQLFGTDIDVTKLHAAVDERSDAARRFGHDLV